MVKIIDGKAIAMKLRAEIAMDVGRLKQERGITPRLSVVLVGNDPASQVYVRGKERASEKAGMIGEAIRLPEKTTQKELNELVKQLNNDNNVHGILVQLPLPKHLDPTEALNEISPEKDVDGLHPLNMGQLLRGDNPRFLPCTANGVIQLILSTGVEIKGKNCVIVGRSNIVGKPVALLLLQRHGTVTICHSRTKNLAKRTKNADILVASVGSPGIIKGNMVKKGAIVIDVGINRVGDKLKGDVVFSSVKKKASHITPVPGGVGPMTIAYLLKNTLIAAQNTL